MKIEMQENPSKIDGRDTIQGEVYLFDGNNDPYFRHQTGICNLRTGTNQALDSIVSGPRFTHSPAAKLVVQ